MHRPRISHAALALVLAGGCTDAPVSTHTRPPSRSIPTGISGDSIARTLGCAACHADMPPFDPAALAAPSLRPGTLDADRTFARFVDDGDPHPDFRLDEGEALALAAFLDADVSRELRDLRRDHPDADSGAGRRIFVALNCAGCHDMPGIEPRRIAPVLAIEGARVRPEWMREFIIGPFSVRPFGAGPGDGGRMPRFAMDRATADSLAAWLLHRTTTIADFTPFTLTPFDSAQIESLLGTRFSCLGCHRIGDRGGRIGPDLSRASVRLRPAYIRAMLERPASLVPGTPMPPTRATPGTLDTLAAWIASLDAGLPDALPMHSGYLGLLDNTPVRMADAGPAAAIYTRMCANCHGDEGGGDGWNARFLRTHPVVHSDSASMAARTDDMLYDAIAAGARFLDRSPDMPGFAGALGTNDIRMLVQYIRHLCDCSGPAWSRDGGDR
jgi:mono/diheme cytochrome c family protein